MQNATTQDAQTQAAQAAQTQASRTGSGTAEPSDGEAYDYVIVGAGIAAASAAGAIRRKDPDGSIVILGREPDGPFYRPDLSKTLWVDADADLDNGWLLKEEAGTELRTGASVAAIDTDAKTVTLADRSTVRYGKLLVATGVEPRRLEVPPSDRIIYYRTVADYRRLPELALPGSRAVVVGGGYIGAEMAAALAQNSVDVTLLMRHATVQGHMFPGWLANDVTQTFRDRGVRVIGNSGALGMSVHSDHVIVADSAGDTHTADVVIVGVGVTPNDEIAQAAGIATDDGVLVDQHLATTAADVWAAGDVARFDDPLLGNRRVEHVNNAKRMGAIAGRNMVASRCGTEETEQYAYTPFFWSDLFDYGYEAVGILDASYETVEDFTDDRSTGVVYYLEDGRVRGVLLWNVWDSVDHARAVMEQSLADPVTAEDLMGRIAVE